MDAKSERKNGVLIFFVNGRLDAFGARQLDDLTTGALHDDDKELVLDLSGSTYLSSGGLRTFNMLKKEMKRRNGRFALAGVRDYPKKVLDTAGFSSLFDIFPTTDSALVDIFRKRKDPTLFNEISYKRIEKLDATLTFEPGWVTTSPTLHVTGDLKKVLYAKLTPTDIRTTKFSGITYSLGLGALGADKKDAIPLLGEMITLHGAIVWLPTDGNNTPDFLTSRNTGRNIPVYTGFNIALDGPFNEYMTLDTEDPTGISITDIYRTIFSNAHGRVKSYRGVIAITIWGVLAGLASSGIKKAPLAGSALPEGVSIMDPAQVATWVSSDTSMKYNGDTLVSFGIGIDLSCDLSAYPAKNLEALYYTNPANTGSSKSMHLHNHGVVFRGVPYDESLDMNSQVKKVVSDAQFVDMRHLLDSTRFCRAKIGVAYIQNIQKEQ
jgi:anti-anti-sigma factor